MAYLEFAFTCNLFWMIFCGGGRVGADRVQSLAPYSGSYNIGTIKYRAGSSIQNITTQQLASSTNWLLTLLCKPMYILTHTI